MPYESDYRGPDWVFSRNIARMNEEDFREHAPGMYRGSREGVEGRGVAPVGWPAFDYEQGHGYRGQGYRRVFLPGERPWTGGYDDAQIDCDEVGVYPPDLSDEMEDWDLSPMGGRRHARDWDFERPPWRLREIAAEKAEAEIKDDPFARAYDEEVKAKAKKAKQEEAERAARRTASSHRTNQRKMMRAARDKILERIANGDEGLFEVKVKSQGQVLRVEYTLKDGKAFIKKKRAGWLPMAERPGA